MQTSNFMLSLAFLIGGASSAAFSEPLTNVVSPCLRHKETVSLSNLNMHIPDGSEPGAAVVKILAPKAGYLKDLKVHVKARHGDSNELEVTIVSPTGQDVRVFHGSLEIGPPDLNKIFSLNDGLQDFYDQSITGEWTVIVADSTGSVGGGSDFAGTLDSVDFEFTTGQAGLDCAPALNFPTNESIPFTGYDFYSVPINIRTEGRILDLQIKVEMEHPNVRNLFLSLAAPNGESQYIYWGDSGEEATNVSAIVNLRESNLLKFLGMDTSGIWTLGVRNLDPDQRTGLLKNVEFRIVTTSDNR